MNIHFCTYALTTLVLVALTACLSSADSPAAQLPAPKHKGEIPASTLRFVRIPAGSFELGCTDGDSACMPDELPHRTIHVAAFELSETETTQAQYRALIGHNPSRFAGCDDCPVEGLGVEQAEHFCRILGGRLPTEAEWEYAARGGGKTIYPCGNDVACLNDVAWYKANTSGTTHPVRQKKPNGFGLYDMIGNVLEFVADEYDEFAYAKALPPGTPARSEPPRPRVLRGGAWSFPPAFLRISLRNHDKEKVLDPSQLGVRCARDLDKSQASGTSK